MRAKSSKASSPPSRLFLERSKTSRFGSEARGASAAAVEMLLADTSRVFRLWGKPPSANPDIWLVATFSRVSF